MRKFMYISVITLVEVMLGVCFILMPHNVDNVSKEKKNVGFFYVLIFEVLKNESKKN